MKFHSKTKQTKKLGYGTPDHFKGKTFRPQFSRVGFNASSFKTQHKG
ncbi:MAG: hypothetical protein UV20_C0012G0006 [Candidatus Magasanikbacteria bacterium GW2011_GWA2_42_32]|uniref:Uncharacterized protein n=1 Tax=Candidatus Magasanikbacteria bacterium GW2011_GWA2_42_32 TaxID=1619039 RepID=A0A0G1A606_9BACT|nr:MAG: hypothetical protein UV20_C0012G0006 [Candidatus Magasanikbacteria bacterium GW2011_GWA2_42_32]